MTAATLARPHSSPALGLQNAAAASQQHKQLSPLEMRDLKKQLQLGARMTTHPCSFRLREMSMRKNSSGMEQRPVSAIECRRKKSLGPTTKIDLLGGNGGWRQQKAVVEFKQRAVEEAERKRQQAIHDEKVRKREAEKEARRKQHLAEEEQHRRDEQERLEREAEEKEQKRKEAQERKRLEREEEQREWERRQPKTCEVCAGQARCIQCDGKGFTFSMFLVSSVNASTKMDYGRAMQGCEDCGGCRQNICGSLKKGSGLCQNCKGVGKVTPKIDPSWSHARKRVVNLSMDMGSTFGSTSTQLITA